MFMLYFEYISLIFSEILPLLFPYLHLKSGHSKGRNS